MRVSIYAVLCQGVWQIALSGAINWAALTIADWKFFKAADLVQEMGIILAQDRGDSIALEKTSQASPKAQLRICIMATSDLHAHLHPYDYYTDQPQNDVGLSRVASLITSLRNQESNTLLLDNGDTFQGTPLGDFGVAERVEKGQTHPMMTAMNSLGYDAMTLGNHDFNFGLPNLERILEDAEFPVILGNVSRADGTALLPAHVLLRKEVMDEAGHTYILKIGILGATPPQIMKWDRTLLEGQLQTTEIVPSVKRSVTALKDEGADLIIALCHSGMGSPEALPDQENAASAVARIEGVDALVAGHTHEVFPNPLRPNPACADPEADHSAGTLSGKPMVQPGYWGGHLGQISLHLEADDQGKWVVVSGRGEVLPISANDTQAASIEALVPSDPHIIANSTEDHLATLEFMRRKIGASTEPLESYFSLISNSSIVKLVADVQREAASALLQGHPLSHLPLLSAAAPFKVGGRGGPRFFTDIPRGPLAIKNAADLYVFPNMLQILKVTGEGVKDWLERAASVFFQIDQNGSEQRLIDPVFAGYNFDVIDGLTYEIDVTQPRLYSANGETRFDGAGRVFNICYQGQPIRADQEFLVVTNTYRGSGGGHFAAAAQADPVLTDPRYLRDILIAHIAKEGVIAPQPTTAWHFTPLGGFSVIFETGPAALNHPERIQDLGLEHLGHSPSGFAQFRLTL